MARVQVPYPPSPTGFPDDLTDPEADSGLSVAAMLAGVVLFLFIYLGLILGCLAIIIVMMVSLSTLSYPLLWVLGSCFAAVLLLILLKGLFNHGQSKDRMLIEIQEEDQPIFFAFIRRLTDEVGASMPHRVFVTFDVNAAMQQEISLVNLFKPPKKNLIVGLALVNVLNLSEFKAVMGHEFGHFTQKTSGAYAYAFLANRVIMNLIFGQDWLDLLVLRAKMHYKSANDLTGLIAGAFAFFVGGALWLARMGLLGLYKIIHLASMSLSRKNEFHADRVAVSVAGSNAIIHALARLHFASECLDQALGEMEIVAQRKQYTNDIYVHHSAAAHFLRKIRKKPLLGEPPELDTPEEGKKIRVFDPDEESPIPKMWSSHPENYDRELNAKEIFVPAPNDERSPWVLFTHRAELREEMTYRMYRHLFRFKKNIELSPALEIQGSIDDEHAEMTFDAKYKGCYDQRFIFPGDIDELNAQVDSEPWANERIESVHAKLYRELGRRVDDFQSNVKATRKLLRRTYGRPRGRDKRDLEDYEDDFKAIMEWFSSFDRRVYLVHAQMAKQLSPQTQKELTHRYRFHLELQTIHRDIAKAIDLVDDVWAGFLALQDDLPPDYIPFMFDAFRDARRVMKRCLKRASEMLTPALANIKKGARFDKLIFEMKLLEELPETFVQGSWIDDLLKQMAHMRSRVVRMDFKSLGAILQMQDRIATEWLETQAPPAMVLEAVESDAMPPAGASIPVPPLPKRPLPKPPRPRLEE